MKFSKDDIYQRAYRAYLDARKNERNKDTQLNFEIGFEKGLYRIVNRLYSGSWKPAPPIRFAIEYPTMREVFAPMFQDRIVSHILFNELNPIVERSLIYDCYSCRKGKGTLFGIERFEHFLRSVTQDYTKEAFVLNVDISGYFMHINHGILYSQIENLVERYRFREYKGRVWNDITDFDFLLDVARKVVFRNPLNGCITIGNLGLFDRIPLRKKMEGTAPDCGLIIGDLPSQLFSNLYLSDYDHYVKRVLKCGCYGRYVDDSFLMSTDKGYLTECKYAIAEYLSTSLGLNLNFAKTKIKSTKRDLTFLGADLRERRRYALSRTLRHFKNEAFALRDAVVAGELLSMTDATDCLAVLNSYLGYLNHFRTYKAVKSIMDESQELSSVFVFAKDYSFANIRKDFINNLKYN